MLLVLRSLTRPTILKLILLFLMVMAVLLQSLYLLSFLLKLRLIQLKLISDMKIYVSTYCEVILKCDDKKEISFKLMPNDQLHIGSFVESIRIVPLDVHNI